MGGNFSLISESFGQRSREVFFRGISKIVVVGLGLSGRKNVDGIMKIVIPFGGKQRRIAILISGMQRNNIAAIFCRTQKIIPLLSQE